jgi:hypothetical protein
MAFYRNLGSGGRGLKRKWSAVEEKMRSSAENVERADAAQPVRTENAHRYLVMLVMVLSVALAGLGACSPADSTAVPETAVTAEIDQFLDDYIGAWNAYDADALRPLLTDGFMWYWTKVDQKHGISTGLSHSRDVALTLSYIEEIGPLSKLHLEWVGEPIMTGDGPWVVSRAWRVTAENYDHQETQGISIYTIVDEDGTLKLAREIEVGFDVK